MSFSIAFGRTRSSTNDAHGLLNQPLFVCKVEVHG